MSEIQLRLPALKTYLYPFIYIFHYFINFSLINTDIYDLALIRFILHRFHNDKVTRKVFKVLGFIK